jgi:hypothetical protein
MALVPIIFALMFALIAIGLGWPIIARCDSRRLLVGAERVLAAFLVGALLLHFAVWAAGVFRYDAASMAALMLISGAASLAGLRSVPWLQARHTLRHLVRLARDDLWFAALLVLCVGLILNGIIAGLAPPSDYDGLNYHLSLPKFDLERGFIAPGDADPFGYLPPLMEMLYRLALPLVGASGAQLIHGLFGVAAAAGTALLIRRWQFGHVAAAVGALMFLGVRFVVWEFGTTYVELALAAYTVAALVVYMIWRDASSPGLMVLFGILIGGNIGVKYHGFPISIAFGALMAADVLQRSERLRSVIIGPAVAALMIVPFLIRNYVAVGNPLYLVWGDDPLTKELGGYHAFLGAGRSVWDFLRAPWDISIYGSHYFDGQFIGAPYLLAFAPLCLLAVSRLRGSAPAAIMAAVYFIEWFWLLSQQVRFLAPIFPIFAAFAAAGASIAWSLLPTGRLVRAVFAGMIALFIGLQSLFVGAYVLIRLPAATGLMDEMSYLTKIPTIQGSHYASCKFISDNLGAAERFVWLPALRSYYCPQAAMLRPLPNLEATPLADYLEEQGIRYVAIQTITEARELALGGPSRQPALAAGPIPRTALQPIPPAFSEPFVNVYDADKVIDALRRYATP